MQTSTFAYEAVRGASHVAGKGWGTEIPRAGHRSRALIGVVRRVNLGPDLTYH